MRIICYGDSNTWGYDPQDKFGQCYKNRWTDILAQKSGWDVINEGVNGREVPSEPAEADLDTDLYIVMLGTNDLLQLDSPDAAAHRMGIFLSGIDPRKLVLIAPPAMVWGEWVQDQELIDDSVYLAKLYKSLADRMGITFLDAADWNIPLAFDGVHFAEDGQEIFAEALFGALSSR